MHVDPGGMALVELLKQAAALPWRYALSATWAMNELVSQFLAASGTPPTFYVAKAQASAAACAVRRA